MNRSLSALFSAKGLRRSAQFFAACIFALVLATGSAKPAQAATTCVTSGNNVTIASACNFDPGTYAFTGTLTISAAVTVTSPATFGSAVTITTGGSITQSGTSAITIAGALTVQSGGNITHAANTTVQANKVIISADTIQIDAGATVNTDGKGFSATNGPGTGTGSYRGGGYGGNGGNYSTAIGGTPYGSVTQPTDLGSGGYATAGGGAIKLTSTGTMIVNGTISANGTALANNSGSSGGSVWLQVGTTLSGNGTVAAKGGVLASGTGGGGGGGRIAITYQTDSSTITKQAFGGTASSLIYTGGAGTIFTKASSAPNGDLYLDNLNHSSNGVGATTQVTTANQTYDNITIANGAAYVIPNGYTLTAASSATFTGSQYHGSVTVNGGGTLNVPSPGSYTFSQFDIVNNGTITGMTGDVTFAGSNLSVASNWTGISGFAFGTSGTFTLSGATMSVSSSTFSGLTVISTVAGATFNGGIMTMANSGTKTLNAAFTASSATFSGSAITPSGGLTATSVTVTGGTMTAVGSQLISVQNLTIGSGGTLIQSSTDPITITGALWVQSGGNITHTTNTTSQLYKVNISAATIQVDAGGTVNTDAKGFQVGTGTGAGSGANAGASYGGSGAANGFTMGPTYGSVTQPTDIGSSGYSGLGGGAVKLVASGTVTINGTVSANGQPANQNGNGSGGSVWIQAGTTLSGAGTVSANGGPSTTYNGGGGGRIALYYQTDASTITKTAYGGAHGTVSTYTGGAGTIYTKATSATNGDLLVDNNNIGNVGTPQVTTASQTYDNVTIKGGTNYIVPSGFTLTAVNTATLASNGTTHSTLTTNAGGTANLPAATYALNAFDIVDDGTVTATGSDFSLTSASLKGAGSFTANSIAFSTGSTLFNSYGSNMVVASSTFSGTSILNVPLGATFNGGIMTISNSGTRTMAGTLGGSSVLLTVPITTLTGTLAISNLTVTGTTMTYANNPITNLTNLTIGSGSTFTFTTSTPLTASGTVTVAPGATIVQSANTGSTKDYAVIINAANVNVQQGATVNVTAKGYPSATGPGAGQGPGSVGIYGGGAGYGGAGGNGSTWSSGSTGGVTYGSATQPIDLGSGGGTTGGGYGGGAVQFTASNTVTIDGAVNANGGNGVNNGSNYGGGGSGGSIFIQTANFAGAGSMSANGGNGYSGTYKAGGGGGGRIYYTSTGNVTYSGSMTVNGGTGYAAGSPGSTIAVNAVPTTTSISPTSAQAGGGNVTVTVNGTGFVANTVGQWNGSSRATTYVSPTQLTMTVLASDIATAGTYSVTVNSPAPGGGTSNAQTFTVNNPTPTIGQLTPSSAVYGGSQFTLTVDGTGFVPGSTVQWNGSNRATTYVSGYQLTATITAADIAAAGSATVSVVNAAPGGGTATATFSVNNPTPTISSLSPSSVQYGAAQFTLTVNGSNFLSSSVIQWNGVTSTTTYVSATQLTTVIPAASVASAAANTVTVFTPAPGGGSASATFNVTNPTPTLSTLSQTTSNAGAAQFTLTLTGTNFVSSSVGQWAGSNRSTTYVSATQLTMVVLASDLTTGGTYAVTVSNPGPGGGVTTGINYTVNNPIPTLSSLNPASSGAGASAFTMTVFGSNFVPTSIVKWNGTTLNTTYVNNTALYADVTAAMVASQGTASITVTNPTPSGGTSSGVSFTIYSAATTCPTSGTNVTISTACNFEGATYTFSGPLTIAAPVTFHTTSTLTFNNDVTVANGGSITQYGTSLVTVNGALVAQYGATLTHAQNTTSKLNVLNIAATTMEIDAGASVDVSGKGFTYGSGTGRGSAATGAGYGGNGAQYTATLGLTYGSATQPTDLGSGGAAAGDNGGGAIKLSSTGNFVMDGSIAADGAGTTWGGSSGGSVWLTAGGVMFGTGVVHANGASTVSANYGGGGGGRLSFVFSTDNSSLSVSAIGGSGTYNGGAGTVYRNIGNQTNGDLVIDNASQAGGSTTQAGAASQTYDNVTLINGAAYIIPATSTLSIPSTGMLTSNGTSARITVNGTLNAPPTLNLTGLSMYDNGTVNGVSDITIASGAVFSQGTTNAINLSGKLWVQNGGQLTHPANTTARVSTINITAGDVQIDAGAIVNVDGMGYAVGYGPGKGNAGIAGGHGGYGGTYANGTQGSAYDAVDQPVDLGSGGSGVGAIGGGAVKIISTGNFVLNGSISANGIAQATPQWAGAAGGSVWIQAGTTLSGTGSITANGSRSQTSGSGYGGGAGGRIAVYYGTDASTLFTGSSVHAYGAAGVAQGGGAGTIYVKPAGANPNLIVDNNGLSGERTPQLNTTETYDDVTVIHKANYRIPSGKTLVVAANHTIIGGDGGTVTIDNGGTLSGTASALVSSANIVNNGTISANTLSTSGTFQQNGTLSATTLTVANGTYYYYGGSLGADNLDVQNGGVFVFAASGTYTNDLTFAGDVLVETGGLITHATNTTATKVYYANITANNITVQNGGSVNVDAMGYPSMTGAGAGLAVTGHSSGAGYGGMGGGSSSGLLGGASYGSSTEPLDLGSGGGDGGYAGRGGRGGGAMKLVATNTMTIDGTLSANGGNATLSYGAGGSGGSIWIQAATLNCNADGLLSVQGGNPTNAAADGAGAGGRIAYDASVAKSINCPVALLGGTGYLGPAGAGTTNDVSPVPVLSDTSPSSVTIGAANTSVTVNGSGFVTSSVVQWNGSNRPTYYVSPTQLTVVLLSTDLSSGGYGSITVVNPAPGGGISGAVQFAVNFRAPTITGNTNPNYRYVNATAFTLVVYGTNFYTGSIVQWNGQDRPTTYINSSQISADIQPSDFATAGNATIYVKNPLPGGGISNGQAFSVYNIRPTLSNVTPGSAPTGGSDTTITVDGADFATSTYITFNANTLATTYVSPTQVTAVIPASMLRTTGNYNIYAYSPYGGGNSTAAFSFAVANAVPEITSLSPTSALAGQGSVTLVVNGAGFISGSYVKWDGTAQSTSYNSSIKLTATIAAADVANAGTHTVTVFTPAPGGGESTGVSFDVTNGVPTLTSISPSTAAVGDADTTVILYGTGFVPTSVAQWNGSDLATTYVNSTQMRAIVPTTLLTSIMDATMTVANPAPGGGVSGTKTFSVVNAIPVLSSISPTSATVGDADFTLTATGSGFSPTSVIKWKGVSRTTTYVSPTTLTATIATADLAAAGSATVTVYTAAPGGGTSAGKTFTTNNPVPTITDLSPASVSAGSGNTVITINGTGFQTDSVAYWNGLSMTTTYVSATQLRATVISSRLQTGGDFPITVVNQTPGGGTSTAQTFSVIAAVPATSSISPTSVTLNASFVNLTVNGSNFSADSIVLWNGVALTTSFVSGSQLTATVPGSDLTSAGTANVTVTNSAGTSNAQSFTINNPTPSPTDLTPSSIVQGSGDTTVTINGSRFLTQSIVQWNGSNLVTTYVSATQLTAVVPAANLTATGNNSVTVFNPTPGGGVSIALNVAVVNPAPTVSSVSPSSITAGSGDTTVTVDGSNFLSGSRIQWNGSNLVTTYVSATQLTAVVPAANLTTAGDNLVTVNNPAPGGGTSAALTVTIGNPTPTISSISPTSGVTEQGSTSLVVNGTNFVHATVVQWDGQARSTTYTSATKVTASLTAADLAAAGTHTVTVMTPAPGGGTTSAISFDVTNPAPVTTGMTPTSVGFGGGDQTVTIYGSGFLSTSVIQWNGSNVATTYISTNQLRATIPAANLSAPGTATVTVVNAAPGGGTSTARTFTIVTPTPVLSSISPTGIGSGAPETILTITGSSFIASSVVQWDGSNRATTFVSSTQLTAVILPTDLTVVGAHSITVSTPNGGVSGAKSFAVGSGTPVLSSISPTSAYLGSSYVTIIVNGSSFYADSVVKWNGTPLDTTYISASQLSATIPGSDLTSAGTAQITVSSVEGSAAATMTFTVNNPTPSITSISPTAVYTQSQSFTLTVNGLGFLPTSVVQWNGSNLPTTYVSATTLSAQVSSALVTSTGTPAISVTNGAPGGGASNTPSFFVLQNVQGNTGNVIFRANVMDVPATVNPPIVTDVANGASISTFHLIAGANATLFIHGTVADPNGCETLSSVAVKVYLQDAGANCTPDGNSCAETTTTVFSGCTPGTTNASYDVTLSLPNNMEPTDLGAPYEGKHWYATATVTDSGNVQGIGTSDPFDIGSLVAFDVTPSIDYGTVQFGTYSDKKQLTFVNRGNRVLNASFLSNGPLVCQGGGSIPSEDVRLSLHAADAFADMTPISALLPTSLSLGLPKKVFGATDPASAMYAQLYMPEHAGVTGACSNSFTFTAFGQ